MAGAPELAQAVDYEARCIRILRLASLLSGNGHAGAEEIPCRTGLLLNLRTDAAYALPEGRAGRELRRRLFAGCGPCRPPGFFPQ